MKAGLLSSFVQNFLDHAPRWYKLTIVSFLVANPIILSLFGPFVMGWLLIFEFIFTLATALKCYPLQSGGLLALEAVIMGLTSPEAVYHEALQNFEVILLLMFMVAGIFFMKDLLMFLFTKLLLSIKNKRVISLLFLLVAAFLSAFLDALTVTAVIISVGLGFYSIYHQVMSQAGANDADFQEKFRHDLETLKGYLRNLLMHAVVGTAVGGVCTLVGEPQNLLIAKQASWEFIEFFLRMAPVTLPVMVFAVITTYFLEKFKLFSYGYELPESAYNILAEDNKQKNENLTQNMKSKLIWQGIVAIWLIVSLALHLAEVGIIGLSVIILLTSVNGIIEEHRLGEAFKEALPFTALIVVFFAVVAVIHEQKLFAPILDSVFAMEQSIQVTMFYLANGFLSMVSDNVFVASVYINEAQKALTSGLIGRAEFDLIAVAINTGTNIPSIATPNGQAAFLFLLTSTIAPLIRLSYGKMVWMAFPYFVVMTLVGLFATIYLLEPWTMTLYEMGWLK